jgi:hypothetical protein
MYVYFGALLGKSQSCENGFSQAVIGDFYIEDQGLAQNVILSPSIYQFHPDYFLYSSSILIIYVSAFCRLAFDFLVIILAICCPRGQACRIIEDKF